LLLVVFFLYDLFIKKRPERSLPAFTLALGVPAWLFLLFVKPELGLARDWDLYAITVLGIAAPGIFSLARTVARSNNPARFTTVLAPAIVFSLALVVSWIGLNASADKSVTRYRAILVYDTTNPGYTYENLALYYQENYQYSLQIDALEKAYEQSHNPRILLKLGRVYDENNNPRKAEQAIRRFLEAVPESKEARVWLISQLAKREGLDEMIELCLEGIGYSPRVPDYYFFLGNAYLAKGDTKDGLKAFETCSRLNPPPAMVREMKRLTDQADDAGRQAD
jgi:tetratricopeptide (TPR) repeat protein